MLHTTTEVTETKILEDAGGSVDKQLTLESSNTKEAYQGEHGLWYETTHICCSSTQYTLIFHPPKSGALCFVCLFICSSLSPSLLLRI